METFYGAAYQWHQSPNWIPVSIGLTPGRAVDAAILKYDDSGSLEPYGWRNEWTRSQKARFLRKLGMRVKKFNVTLAG